MARVSLVLPKYEYAIRRLLNAFAYSLHMQDEILKLFPPVEVIHIGTSRLVSKPNILDRTFQNHKTKFTTDPDMFLQTDAFKFRDILIQLNTSLQDQQKKQTVEVMLETGEAAGNSIDGKGRNFWDVYIEMLEKLDSKFQSYTLYMNPETEREMMKTPQTEEQRQRIREVVKAKREEYQANKRHRRLV